MTPENRPLSERLLKGAMKLGALWRSKRRCAKGWSFDPLDLCMMPCACNPKTDFCNGRLLWITLAFQNGQGVDVDFGEYELGLMMTMKQWDASGLTMSAIVEKGGDIKIGPKGMMPMAHLAKLAQDPASAASIFALTKAFPKARVEGIVEPESGVAI